MRRTALHFKIVIFYSFVLLMFFSGTLLGNRAVTVFSVLSGSEQTHCIVIDAGHGGEDGGAVSCSGKNESMFNLQIALRLDDLFHLLGYRTVMIRQTDRAVYTAGETIAQKKVSDLKQRVQIANHTPNSILISIHQNTFPEGKYSGSQVFYANNTQSIELAKRMQANLVSNLNPGSNRKEKQGSGIYLLEKVQIPGILVECGFLSNVKEEALLQTPEYQKKLCCVIASTAAGFLSNT